ncbi:MAG: hypothetical protein HYU66_19835 [Armatimonadetes bacterium]|nr:hypothetical protein [Armatimonadota bacterium]
MIPDLVGIACQAIARRPAWVAVDHLSATEARSAALLMNALLARQVTLREVWAEEKWFQLAAEVEQLSAKGWATDQVRLMW